MINRTMSHGVVVILAMSTMLATTLAAAAEAKSPDKKAIAEVAAGTRTEAHASWWGFDPIDSTASLQAAINSGARKLLVDNMGAPWVVNKLQLAGNQEIVFAKGVVVQAKRGEFHGRGDSLFYASLKKNITLTGYGATLKMWKQDYDDRKQYRHAEWRHVLDLYSCAQVRISGLTLADSGGDGVYLGVARKGVPCSDVVIRDVKCVNNYRQGISVISARNLLIENCLLKDTWGTAPMAGIDFEPNRPSDQLTNCVMRNCLSENNRGGGYVLYLRALRAESKPISVRIENCRSVGCRSSAAFSTGNDNQTAAVKGTMDFVHCTFERSRQAAITIGDKPVNGARVSFVNCKIIDPAADRPASTPIMFSRGSHAVSAVGGVHFQDCTIEDPINRRPMSYHDSSGGAGLAAITGTLTVRRGDRSICYQLTPALIAQWMPHKSFKRRETLPKPAQ